MVKEILHGKKKSISISNIKNRTEIKKNLILKGSLAAENGLKPHSYPVVFS